MDDGLAFLRFLFHLHLRDGFPSFGHFGDKQHYADFSLNPCTLIPKFSLPYLRCAAEAKNSPLRQPHAA